MRANQPAAPNSVGGANLQFGNGQLTRRGRFIGGQRALLNTSSCQSITVRARASEERGEGEEVKGAREDGKEGKE
eukprot:PDM84618.1 hypothetical protein PRIPAC_33641 [Pristionchus pacificus]